MNGNRLMRPALAAVILVAVCSQSSAQGLSAYSIKSVPFERVKFTDGFWKPRLDTNASATVYHTIEQCVLTGRIDNFAIAAGTKSGTFKGWWFNDSDVYKSIEGAAYSMKIHPDPALEKKLDEIIAQIASAQEPDGYLYSPRHTTAPDYRYAQYVGTEKWSRLASSHELYDLGHLYEAAVAYYHTTGKRALLDVAIKSANLLTSLFGPGKNRSVPGHQEIEIGLTKLAQETGTKAYATLAKFFLDERGHRDGHELYGEYSQDHKPVVEQDSAVGHAVRALYMYSAMADMVALYGDQSYRKALERLWEDVVDRKIYLTGGIGAAGGHEGFSYAFELPNLVAYCETCASIANVLWNQRMFQLTGDGKYVDVLERTLYNALLSGVAFDGRNFFYPNPLESDGSQKRSPWFAVACCPPNISRILPQVGGMAYASTDKVVYVNLFASSSATISVGSQEVKISQVTEYPWNGRIQITIEPGKQGATFPLYVRVPGWARNEAIPGGLYRFVNDSKDQATVRVNGKLVDATVDANGYIQIRTKWSGKDIVEVNLPMPVRRVVSRDEVKADVGRVAIQRGPLVYCIEWPDVKDGSVGSLVFNDGENLKTEYAANELGGVTTIRGKATSLRCLDGNMIASERVDFTAIPYYAWAHRGQGEMFVWLARTASVATPVPCPTIASMSEASASGGNPRALNDQKEAESSGDHTYRYLHWWPHKGTSEWVQYDFTSPTKVSTVEVYWFDDTGVGECRVPKSWTLLYKDGDEWKPVKNASAYGTEKDRYNETHFDPILTKGLRIMVQLPDDFSAGIHEWRVH